jgi:hypothetical protein
MTKRIIALTLGIIFVLVASMAWADHVDKEIARQQALIDHGTASGQLSTWDAGRAQHTLDRIKHDAERYRERGRYTPRVAEKLSIKLQKNSTRLHHIKK